MDIPAESKRLEEMTREEAERLLKEAIRHRQKAERELKEAILDRQKAELELKEAIRDRQEAERDREEAERELKDTLRDGQEAERALKKAIRDRQEAERVYQPTTIPELLGHYHTKSLTVNVENEGFAIGVTSEPVGSKYPKLITPWNGFASNQQNIWNTIRASSTYPNRLFDCTRLINMITLRDVRSETDLVINDSLIVLNPVKAILKCLYKDRKLREQLKLQGDADFRSSWDLIDGSQALNYPKDVGAQADELFVSGPSRAPRHAYSIDYPPLFEFSATDIVRGLQGEIFPDQEVMNNGDKGPDHDSRRLVTVMITPLYSCLLKAGICYGYINTGDMIIFLHILDDPGHVECHVWNPRDFDFNHSAFTHNTAIAEVVAFSIQALNADRQTKTWSDAAARLESWPQEYDGIPDDTPKTDREERTDPDTCGYKPGEQADSFGRSSFKTAQQAQYKAGEGGKKKDDELESPSLRKGKSGCRPKGLGVTKKSEDLEDVESGNRPIRPSDHTGRSLVGGAGKEGKGDACGFAA